MFSYDRFDLGKYTVITLDEALYCTAKMLQWTKTNECKSLVLMLEGFHTQMSFTKVIGKFTHSCGLSVIKAHKLTYEALWRIFWPLIVKWSEEKRTTLDSSLEEHTNMLIAAFLERDRNAAGNACSDIMETIAQVQLEMPQMTDGVISNAEHFVCKLYGKGIYYYCTPLEFVIY